MAANIPLIILSQYPCHLIKRKYPPEIYVEEGLLVVNELESSVVYCIHQ
jgi:hypothetical protein